MAIAISTPADVVNASLRQIGFKLRTGNLYDGSDHSSTALDIYSQTRDTELANFDWPFAERTVALTLLKTAPANYVPPATWSSTYPPLPWLYEYAFPSDAVKIRAIKETPLFVFNPDPMPVIFDVANDTYSAVVQRVILANIPSAIAVYTGRVTDPTTWDTRFTATFISALATKLTPALQKIDAVPLMAQQQGVTTAMAERDHP